MNTYKQKGITVHKNFVLLCMSSLRIYPILGKHSWYHVKRSPNHPYPQRIRRSEIGKVCPHCLPSGPPNPPPNHSRWPNSLPSHHRALASILQCDTRAISLSLQPGFPPARAFESALWLSTRVFLDNCVSHGSPDLTFRHMVFSSSLPTPSLIWPTFKE